ncbi:NAD(P)H-binding protein [Nonomuraea sp. NPDC048881]|uniref:NAD(P)-dependent oxidoreductase n=1 Tax=Nonomuraea sp. NPDC048881 TaxID=3155030 RepID=UPI0033F26413
MSRIVVFGAGGRAGARVVGQAVERGHEVTAVVRDPGRYAGPSGDGVRVVAGDVTDRESVAAVAAGHDVAVQASVRLDVPSAEFYTAAARALTGGLAAAGVPRLVALGIGTLLEVAPGTRLVDTPGFPEDARTFSLGHAAELEVFRAEGGALDWVVIAPPPVVLDDRAERSGRHRFGGEQVMAAEEGGPVFSYADLAAAVVAEIEDPRHHRAHVAVGY